MALALAAVLGALTTWVHPLWGALAIRDWRQQGWLATWFALGTLGMLLGYAAHDLHWNVPWLIPHEFQWHVQLALGLAAAFGITRIAARITTLRAARAMRAPGAPRRLRGQAGRWRWRCSWRDQVRWWCPTRHVWSPCSTTAG